METLESLMPSIVKSALARAKNSLFIAIDEKSNQIKINGDMDLFKNYFKVDPEVLLHKK